MELLEEFKKIVIVSAIIGGLTGLRIIIEHLTGI